MPSSLETLVKILKLEQRKGYKNDAVIGGFGRFSRHWAREAHAQARTDGHHGLVDDIAGDMRRYDSLKSPEERADLIELMLEKAAGKVAEEEFAMPQAPPPPPGDEGVVDAGEEAPTPEPKESQQKQPRRAKSARGRRPKASSLRERRDYKGRDSSPETPVTQEELAEPVASVSGVGSKRAEQLEKLGVETVGDLLRLYPRRYDDYSRLKTIDRLDVGEEVTVVGTVGRAHSRKTRTGKPLFEATLSDGTAALRLTWFNQPWMERQLKDGRQIVVSGKVDQYLGYLTMTSPDWEPIERELLHTGRVVPIYPLTKGLGARTMRGMMKGLVDEMAPRLGDSLPLDMRERLDLMDRGDAIGQAHFPDSWEDLEAAQRRLAYGELFMLQLAMLRQRQAWQSTPAEPVVVEDAWVEGFTSNLPYALTGAQQRALDEIRRDLAAGVPMNRLLQGDVGSGKTVVAAAAMGMALAAGKQAALMAPTSILAEQHYAELGALLELMPDVQGASLGLLTGALPEAERQAVYAGLADGSIRVVVGTHALIQEGVAFENLGVVVIDEQHRFGVEQRGALRGKGTEGNPHLLVMTATPIPRTLALTVHADLDLTLLDEMPPGRQPVETRVVSTRERERTYAFLRSQVDEGRQAFVIYPLVEESELVEAKAATAEFERLKAEVFPDLSLGLVHGQMKPAEKEAAMAAFYRGETSILVSTTVIEVGIDVPNASVMVVEDASRFGLAQLHQLRGRVGRGEHASYCLLVAEIDTVNGGNRRLAALEETNDGFRLAEIDWELRGAGDLLGTRQSGFVGRLDFARLMDPRLVELAQHEVQALLEADPVLEAPGHARLAEELAQATRSQVVTQGDVS